MPVKQARYVASWCEGSSEECEDRPLDQEGNIHSANEHWECLCGQYMTTPTNKQQSILVCSLGRILGPKVSPWSSRVVPSIGFSRFYLDSGAVSAGLLLFSVRFVFNRCNRSCFCFHGFVCDFRRMGPSAVAGLGAAL